MRLPTEKWVGGQLYPRIAHVDSHEEWAGFIPMVVTQTAHSDLLTASRHLTLSGTRANDPLGIPRRWRRPLPAAGAHTAPGAPSLSPTSIGMCMIFTGIDPFDVT